jgi:hypothetical protein
MSFVNTPILASIPALQIAGLSPGIGGGIKNFQVERQAAENDLVIVRGGVGIPGA